MSPTHIRSTPTENIFERRSNAEVHNNSLSDGLSSVRVLLPVEAPQPTVVAEDGGAQNEDVYVLPQEDEDGYFPIGEVLHTMETTLRSGRLYLNHTAEWWADHLKDMFHPDLLERITGIPQSEQ